MRARNSEDSCEEVKIEIARQGTHLYLFGEIDYETGRDVCAALHAIEEEILQNTNEGEDPEPIHLHISSQGGDISPAIAIVSVIQRSRVPVWSWVDGEAKSAAVIVSVAAHKRMIAPHAEMMIHPPFVSGMAGKPQDLADSSASILHLESRITNFLCAHAHPGATKEIRRLAKREICFGAQKALEMGFVDEIL